MTRNKYSQTEKNTLLKTNLLICVVISIGFILTSYIGYKSNNAMLKKDIENVSSLAVDGIYNEIESVFSRPVSVSLTMANDSLLKNFLMDEMNNLSDQNYVQTLQKYLDTYRSKYVYDSVFLVSAATNRYYHFNGLDRVLEKGNPENDWYYAFLEGSDEYSLNVDNDEASDNIITIFVNCKLTDDSGAVIGVVGVGVKVDSLQALLREYDEAFDVEAKLIDNQGFVQISSVETGYHKVDIFSNSSIEAWKNEILENKTELKSFWHPEDRKSGYVSSRYVPNLKWHLIVESNTAIINQQLSLQMVRSFIVIMIIIILVLFITTRVIKRYNDKITEIAAVPELEYRRLLHKSITGEYESLLELDLTNMCAGSEETRKYLKELGIDENAKYDDIIRIVASKQIKDVHADEYLKTFCSENLLEIFHSGINSLSRDYLVKLNSEDYHWMRFTAQIFYWASDDSVRLITYRRNIDQEKQRELALVEKSQRDSMTGLYNKRITEELVTSVLKSETFEPSAFIIFDIDDFKRINDQKGHAYGDDIIFEVAAEIKKHFRNSDIIGRIGGDEFVVFMNGYDEVQQLKEKVDCLIDKIFKKTRDQGYAVSISVGAALCPYHGSTYSELYQKSDKALYYSKAKGKGCFTIFDENTTDLK